jgi:AcrR family transcriptional regulator
VGAAASASSAPRPARARQKADRRRRDILDAAWALLLAQPYPEVTLAGVAARAGLAKGTAFLYFRSSGTPG